MPTYIVKPVAERDFYVLWSTVVDNVIAVGSRTKLLAEPDITEERLARADELGSSAITPRMFGWHDDEFLAANVRGGPSFGWLKRSELIQFALLMVEGRDEDAAKFLRPVEEDE